MANVSGVRAVESMSHRLAYVGADLQDLYGIDPRTIAKAAPLQDAYTPGSKVSAVMRSLAATRDGVLLSQETLHDYQLRTGDLVRLQAARHLGQLPAGVVPRGRRRDGVPDGPA